jgi:hypothetical protein
MDIAGYWRIEQIFAGENSNQMMIAATQTSEIQQECEMALKNWAPLRLE